MGQAAADAASPRVSIQLLGRFAVLLAGQEQPERVFGSRLARQLLRMLAVSRGTLLSKDVAIEALWPTHPPVDAPGNVEILISRIRRALGDRSLIQTGSGGYTLVGDDRCWVDVEAFLSAVGRGQTGLRHNPAAALAAFQAALAIWQGEPLAEDAYMDWAIDHRHHLFRAHLDALEGAATAALTVGGATSAVAWAQAAADQHPLRETAALLLVRALAASGDRAAALASFDAFGGRLADELGIDPSANALRIRQQVLRDEIPSAPTSGSAPPDEHTTSQPLGSASGSVLPFVDRGDVRTRIARLLADRQVRVVLVRGGPGSGKSRLLTELVDHLDLPAVLVRAQRARRDDPGALAVDVLRAVGAQDIADVAYLRSVAGWPDEVSDDGVVWAVRAAVRAVHALARPRCLIAIDDLHWADDNSLALLRVLRQRVPGLRVLATCPTARPRDCPDLVEALAGADPGLVRQVELEGVSAADLAEVVVDPALRALVTEDTDGADRTPAFVASALATLAREHLADRDERGRWRLRDPGLASRAREVMGIAAPSPSARMAELPVTGREVLTLLALLERRAPAGLLAAAADLDLRTVLDELDALRAAGLVDADGEGWAVDLHQAGRTVTGAVLAELDPTARMRRHLMLVQALRERGADVAEVARHLAEAGDPPEAAAAFAEAAEARLNQVADRDALRLAQTGLATAPSGQVRALLLHLSGEAHQRRGQLRDARADWEHALTEVTSGPERSRILARQAILETRSRNAGRGDELAALAVAEAGNDPAAGGQALAAQALVDLWLARPTRANRRARQARRALHRAGDPDGTARLLHWHAMAGFLAGRLPEAAAELDQLAQLPPVPAETLDLWNPRATRGHVLVFLGEPEPGLSEINTALAWARAVDHPVLRSSCLWRRSEALTALGRPAEAADAAQAALAIARRIDHAEWTAASLRALGIARHAAGDLDGAETACRDALRASDAIPLFAGWTAARLGLVLVAQGRLADAEPLIDTALCHAVPVARHEARWAHAELLHARHDPAARQIAAAALSAAGKDGYRALLPRLVELAGA